MSASRESVDCDQSSSPVANFSMSGEPPSRISERLGADATHQRIRVASFSELGENEEENPDAIFLKYRRSRINFYPERNTIKVRPLLGNTSINFRVVPNEYDHYRLLYADILRDLQPPTRTCNTIIVEYFNVSRIEPNIMCLRMEPNTQTTKGDLIIMNFKRPISIIRFMDGYELVADHRTAGR